MQTKEARSPKRTLSVRVPAPFHRQLRSAADARGETVSELVRRLLLPVVVTPDVGPPTRGDETR